jgi:hypothetical protein
VAAAELVVEAADATNVPPSLRGQDPVVRSRNV